MINKLTETEKKVLELMAEGLSNKLIAARLDISDHTAKFHVTNVCKKLGAQTRTHAAVMYALEKGFQEGMAFAQRANNAAAKALEEFKRAMTVPS